MNVNLSNKYVRGGYFMKISKTKLLTVVVFILVVLSLDYFYRISSLPSTTFQDNGLTPHNGLVPEMQHNVMISTIGKTPLVLTVFYECLCPDSKSFFIKHLLPSILKAPQFISAVLIPYGKAKTNTLAPGKYKFTCQHGEVECFGNKIHACVIAKVQNMLTQVQLITCMIADNINPKEIGHKCCETHNVDWHPIQTCALGLEGDILLKQHGDRTNSVVPPVSFIPTVLINGNRGNQPAVLKNLWKELCRISEKMSVVIEECKI